MSYGSAFRDLTWIEWNGINDATRVARVDAKLDEAIQDKTVLHKLAEKRFTQWWRETIAEWEKSLIENDKKDAKTAKQLDEDDLNNIQRLFVGSFMQQYQKDIKRFEELGHVPDPVHSVSLSTEIKTAVDPEPKRPVPAVPVPDEALATLRAKIAAGVPESPSHISVSEDHSPDESRVEIVNTYYSGDSRVYEVELTDPTFLSEPVRVEIVVDDEGSAELREVTDDDR